MRRGSRAGLSLCVIGVSSCVGDICEDIGCAGYDEGGPGIRLRSAAVVMSSLPMRFYKSMKIVSSVNPGFLHKPGISAEMHLQRNHLTVGIDPD
jgi:hypothetical protein